MTGQGARVAAVLRRTGCEPSLLREGLLRMRRSVATAIENQNEAAPALAVVLSCCVEALEVAEEEAVLQEEQGSLERLSGRTMQKC